MPLRQNLLNREVYFEMNHLKRAVALGLALMIAVSPVGETAAGITTEVMAAGYEGEGTLQILSTTDLHGQSVNYNYNTASDRKAGSLAQIVYLAKKLKKNLKHGATIMVDSGDTVYGYGSESLMDGTTSGVEYMYKEMLEAGYDAITLGNHDFDYGFDYIQEKLKSSGMKNKVVCANVFHAKSRKPVWKQSMVIKKTLTTNLGVKETLRIGVVGATIPTLTTFYAWQDELNTGDVVEQVKAQSDALKASGCDVVVAVVHSGFGSKNPKSMSDNMGYALSKVGSVDVICMGHLHKNFPSDDSNVDSYYDYPGVDLVTNLVNGKIVVQEADHGQSLGISKVKFSFVDGHATIINKSVKLRKIKATDKQDSKIVKLNKEFDKEYAVVNKRKIATADYLIANYFGMAEDLPVMQMVNEAKIAYGLRMIEEKLPDYKNYPVISATSYQVSGKNGSEDYAVIDGAIKKSNLMKFQPSGQDKVKMYTLSGKQLRETLEWEAASMYEQVGKTGRDDWSDEKMQQYADEGYQSLLKNSWINDWTKFSIYDGVEYTIDLTQPARYSKKGALVSTNAHRIQNLTVNGKKVTDTTQFVFVTRNLNKTLNPIIGGDLAKQKILPKSDYLSEIYEDYIEMQCPDGKLHSFLTADDNWELSMPAGQYVVKTSNAGENYATGSKSWFGKVLSESSDGYGYYSLNLGGEIEDTAGPLLVAAPLKVIATGNPVEVMAYANDVSGIDTVEYKKGIYTNDSSEWRGATKVNKSFMVSENGVYTVRAVDKKGNATVRYVDVENIDENVSEAPTVKKFTNKKTAVTGKASPGATVYVRVGGQTYKGKADGSGNYSVAVGLQKADKKVSVWQVDTRNRTSAKTVIYVTRKGGNQPTVNQLTNKQSQIKGELNDSQYCTIAVVRNSKYIYIPESKLSYYQLTSYYKKDKYTIKKCGYKFSDGEFKLNTGYFNAGDKLSIYSIDWNGRLSSATTMEVEDVAPNIPTASSFVIAEEGVLSVKLNKPKSDREYRAFVSIDGERTYATVSADNKFVMDVGPIETDSVVKVGVQDALDGTWRTSATRKIGVMPMDTLEDEETGDVLFDDLDDKMTTISGAIEDYVGDLTLLLPDGRQTVTVSEEGEFVYDYGKKLKKNTAIGLILRTAKSNIKIFGVTRVLEAAPEDPEWITEKITEDTKTVKIFDEDKDKAILKVSGKEYSPSSVTHSESRGGYVYTFKVRKLKKNKTVYCWLTNTGGDSKKIRMTVKKGKKKKKKKTEEEQALEALAQATNQ